MPSKKVTIEGLAIMVKKGFDETATRVQVDKIEACLDNIEKMILRQQNEKTQNLERRVNRLEEMFAVK